jgi:hypothetical protein
VKYFCDLLLGVDQRNVCQLAARPAQLNAVMAPARRALQLDFKFRGVAGEYRQRPHRRQLQAGEIGEGVQNRDDKQREQKKGQRERHAVLIVDGRDQHDGEHHQKPQAGARRKNKNAALIERQLARRGNPPIEQLCQRCENDRAAPRSFKPPPRRATNARPMRCQPRRPPQTPVYAIDVRPPTGNTICTSSGTTWPRPVEQRPRLGAAQQCAGRPRGDSPNAKPG